MSTFTLPTVVDNSMLNTARSCLTKFKNEFIFNLRVPGTSPHLHAGGCFAKAIEVAYRALYAGESRDMSEALASVEFSKMWGNYVPPANVYKTRERVWEALISYLDKYEAPHDYIEPWTGVADPFEFSFGIPLEDIVAPYPVPSGHIYAGRFDMLGFQMGQPRIRDDKTTSGLGPSYERQFSLRSQFMGYCAAMQVLGYDVDTVEIRGIAILKGDIKHEPVVKTYPPHLIDRWKWQTARTVRALTEACEKDEWDWNFGESCASYGGCAFLDSCRSDNPERWFSTYETKIWNPLAEH